MEIDFRNLNILPGATEVKHSAYHKEGLASVYSSYITSKTYDEIRSYFLDEAIKNGWTFVKETPVTEQWGKDFGGKKISFKKNQYLLYITHHGEKANDKVTFDVSIRWSIW